MSKIDVIYDGPVVKKADAKSARLNKFFTGIPCRNGHVDQRYVVSHECVTCVKNKASMHAKNNPDMAKARARRYKKKNFPNTARPSSKRWAEEHPDKIAEYRRNRRAKIANSEGHHTKDDIENILHLQKYKCAEPTCGVCIKDNYHVDHVMPIALGGSNWPSNIQCLCQRCNNRKHAKHPIKWANENGRLF